MAKKSKGDSPVVVVAGPGAGKTHNMVNEIVASVPRLQHGRFLAAITYTNAAAEIIRSRLHRACLPTRSIFIGTIHAFLNRFILAPYGVIWDEIPDESIFMAVDLKLTDKTSGEKLTGPTRTFVRNAIYKKMLNKGVVPYDQISTIAAKLIEDATIRRSVGNRLQFLFVDEFQDVDTTQFRVFESLRKERRTRIYVVGDPEQYISSFTYGVRGQKAPDFKKIPFFRFATQGVCQHLEENHRSCREIVAFTNQFHSQLTQKAKNGDRGCARVVFLSENELDQIVERFQEITDNWHQSEECIARLYLAYTNSMFDNCRDRFGLVPVSNSTGSASSLLSNALETIARMLQMSQQKARQTFNLDVLEWRKKGLRMLKKIRSGVIKDQSELCRFIQEELPAAKFDKHIDETDAELEPLVNAVLHNTERKDNERVASIHKAKGLEADGVLAVARTVAELRKWCEVNSAEREIDRIDSCRIGFVAFSRAKEGLVIACMKRIDGETKKHLMSLGVAFV